MTEKGAFDLKDKSRPRVFFKFSVPPWIKGPYSPEKQYEEGMYLNTENRRIVNARTASRNSNKQNDRKCKK